MIGHLTKNGKMKGNSGVPHLVDVECSIIKVLPSRIKLFSDMSSLVHAREFTGGNVAAWRKTIKNFCNLVCNESLIVMNNFQVTFFVRTDNKFFSIYNKNILTSSVTNLQILWVHCYDT